MQNELTQPGALLNPSGGLSQVGWSRQPLLDCNLEKAVFYPPLLRPFQGMRLKRWDYYAVFTPQRFFSATIAHLGYAGNIFVYTLDFASLELHEEGLVVPLGSGVELPRNSELGISSYEGKGVSLRFETQPERRRLLVDWPAFHGGRGIHADLILHTPLGQELMTIVIPIEERRFYYNRKINCLPVEGSLDYGDLTETLSPESSLGSLDWGRGVWAYQILLELGQRLGFPDWWSPDWLEPGLRLWRYFSGHRKLYHPGRAHPKAGPGALRLFI